MTQNKFHAFAVQLRAELVTAVISTDSVLFVFFLFFFHPPGVCFVNKFRFVAADYSFVYHV